MIADVGFWSWLTEAEVRVADAPVAERSYSIADPGIAMLLGYSVPGTPSVSEHSALTLSAVWRAAGLVAGSVAGLPLQTLRSAGDGLKTPVPSFLDNPGGEWMTSFEWAERVMLHALLQGNSYLQHIFNGAGQLVALNPVHPSCVSTTWDASRPGGKLFRVSPTEVAQGPQLLLDATTMTQVMGPSLDGLTGLSVISLARLSMGTALAGDKAAHRMLANGALISGLVTPSGEDDLDADEAKVVKDSINRSMTGPENAGDIAVVNRRLEFTPWSLSAVDAQFLESRTFSIDEIGRWFGVPPHLLGLTEKSTSWGQGIAEQNRGLARYTLAPWTSRIEQRVSRLLTGGVTAAFDYSGFTKPSPEDEIGLLIQQVGAGLMTVNEARKVRNLPPVAGGDEMRVSANTLALDAPQTSGVSNGRP